MLKLARIDPLHAEVVLPAILHSAVHASDKLGVRPLLPGTPEITGQVQVVDQLIDPASGTFRIRLLIPNAQRNIPAGVRCEVKLPEELERVAAAATAGPLAVKGVSARATP